METQIINDNSCIRVINDGTPLLIIKTQVKTIDTVKNEMVRIDIGEGALKHIYINYADVTIPAGVGDVFALRDVIKAMLDTPQQSQADLTPLMDAMQNCCKGQTDGISAVKASVDSLSQQVTTSGNTQSGHIIEVKAGIDTLASIVTATGNAQTQNLAAVKESMDTLNQQVATSGNTQSQNIVAVKTSVDNLAQQVTASGNTQSQNIVAVKTSVDTLTQQVTASGNTQTQNLTAVKQSVDALAQISTNQSGQLDGIKQEVINSGKNQSALLTSMAQTLVQINQTLATANNNLSQPVRVDESVPMVVYNGFAGTVGAATADPVWAIQRITRNGDMYIYEWANGNKQYTNSWDKRYNLNYLPAGL